MKEAINLLRGNAHSLRGSANDHPAMNALREIAKEYEDAANLLEKLTSSNGPNQVGKPLTAASAHMQMANYAAHDAFLTMALFVGVPQHVAENLLGLISYIKELEEKASGKTPT